MNNTSDHLDLSIIIPCFNEVESLPHLCKEIDDVLAPTDYRAEAILIDDGSNDGSNQLYPELSEQYPWLRVILLKRNFGQTAAMMAGIDAARGEILVPMDADLQNDPADIPKLLKAYQESSADNPKTMIVGHRAKRQDSLVKRLSSKIANGIRASLLGDATPDTGCGLKVFRRQDFLDLPSFDHMHRFLPALMLRNGGQVVSVEVSHRSRERGKSKYGTFDRLWVGITDLIGVMWLKRRSIDPEIKEDQ